MKILKKSVSLFLLLAMFWFLAPQAKAEPKFRRPISATPVFSSFYDNQAGLGLRKYTCVTSGTYEGHAGTDLATAVGTPVYASAVGGLYYRYNGCPTYGYLGSTCGGGYGNNVRIDHEGVLTDGIGWVTLYAHLQLDTAVWPMSVLCGAGIAKSGSSGNSSGPHLHFEVRKYAYPGNDPFSGYCSHSTSFWVSQVNGLPTTSCQ